MQLTDTLKRCSVEGLIVKLPAGQLERNDYLEVKKALELIGGSWKGGNTQGFVFKEDPSDYLSQLCEGEKINLKKEFQFFGTPPALADQLVELAELQSEYTILEPSAGQGAIVKAIHRVFPELVVDCYELMDLNRSFLEKLPNTCIIGSDFITEEKETVYDCIIGNPPFSKNQDIDHVYEMYRCARKSGRVVSIMSNHWRSSSANKECEFLEWLAALDAKIIHIEEGAFKESGTNISACIVVIDKQDHVDAPEKKIQSTTKSSKTDKPINSVKKETISNDLFSPEELPEPEVILDEIIESIEGSLNRFRRVKDSIEEPKQSFSKKLIPKPDESLKQFEDSFNSFAYRFGQGEVFIDFLDYVLLVMKWWEPNRDFSYFEKKYSDIYPKFAQMLELLSIASDNLGEGYRDALGDLFMELVSGGRNGQFFTPDNVCDMMSQMTMPVVHDGENILDPACGSARMLLAAGKRNRNAWFFGCDNDVTCCKMAVINLLQNTLQGEIALMNSLTMEYTKSWEVSYLYNSQIGGNLPVYRVIEDKEDSVLWKLHMNSFNQQEAVLQENLTPEIQEPTISILETVADIPPEPIPVPVQSKKSKHQKYTQLQLF